MVINPVADQTGTQDVLFELFLAGSDLPVFPMTKTKMAPSMLCPLVARIGCHVSFTETALTLTGIPGNSDVGDNTVTLVATDPHPQWDTFANPASHQAQVSHSFNISVANVNDAPHVRGQGLRDRCVMRGSPGFELEVTAGGGDAPFDDIDFAVDPNEALTFAKTPGNIWPSWMDLDTTPIRFLAMVSPRIRAHVTYHFGHRHRPRWAISG